MQLYLLASLTHDLSDTWQTKADGAFDILTFPNDASFEPSKGAVHNVTILEEKNIVAGGIALKGASRSLFFEGVVNEDSVFPENDFRKQ